MDENGYPTDEELETITKWSYKDFPGLMDYVSTLWHWDNYFKKEGNHYTLVTGGWSGNEALIGALQDNRMFWMNCWELSQRGGLYEFEIPESLIKDKEIK